MRYRIVIKVGQTVPQSLQKKMGYGYHPAVIWLFVPNRTDLRYLPATTSVIDFILPPTG